MYITTQPQRAISSRHLFQRLNPSRVVLGTNTFRVETSCYTPKRVIRANYSEVIVRLSEVRSTFVSEVKYEVHVTSKVKDYATSVVCKNSLIDFSNISNPTLIVSKYIDIIPSKFKAIKFMLE